MSFVHVQWGSRTLEKQVGSYVILPDSGTPPFATFYLLHGLSDDYTLWHRRTRIELYVEKLPLIVVMPDGYRGFYTNNNEGPAYAKYIGEDLVQFIELNFPARAERSARCIGGLSMGGYGAMRIALGYPDQFASANSHSGALMAGTRLRENTPERRRIFGADPRGSDHDLLRLAERAKSAGNLPAMRIDCGVDDFLLNDNRDFIGGLKQMGIAHEYEEFPGNHNWDYWDLHVRDAIGFHARNLKIAAGVE